MHMIRIFLFSITCLCLFSTTKTHADALQQFDAGALSILKESKDPAILGIHEEKIYLNPSCVSVNEDGIFLLTSKNELLQLTALFCNQALLYTRISRTEPVDSTVWPIIKCKKCGRDFVVTIFNRDIECPYCGAKN